MIYVIIGAVMVCLGLVICTGFEKDKFSSASTSSRAAKWRGVYLSGVKLDPIDTDQKERSFVPADAWVETVYENNQSLPWMRTKTSVTRFCVRFQYAVAGGIDHDTSIRDVEMAMDGVVSTRCSSRWDAQGVTFHFPPDANGKYAPEGEIEFENKAKEIKSKFRYSIQ